METIRQDIVDYLKFLEMVRLDLKDPRAVRIALEAGNNAPALAQLRKAYDDTSAKIDEVLEGDPDRAEDLQRECRRLKAWIELLT